MIELKLNSPQEVNKAQYNFARKFGAGLLAHRISKEGKFFIKPLIYLGYKKQLEQGLNQLS